MSVAVAAGVRTRGFGGFLERWFAKRRAQETYDEIMALDNRTLRDIGLTRSEIRATAERYAGF